MNRSFVVPSITLDRSARAPLRQQIQLQLAAGIRGGTLPAGARLPSSRLLAKLLGVSRNTVVDAYEDLLNGGMISTKAGSGVQVSQAATNTIPNFSNLRRTARAAHYPARTIQFEDEDGTTLYLNVIR